MYNLGGVRGPVKVVLFVSAFATLLTLGWNYQVHFRFCINVRNLKRKVDDYVQWLL